MTRFVAVLKLPRYQVPLLLTRARGIVERMTGNSWFPSPSPSLTVIQAAIDDLSEAETTVAIGPKGSATPRDEKRLTLVMRLQALAGYVEAIANANPEQGASIIESAGMYVKKTAGRTAQVFRVRRGRVSGEVDVAVPVAGERAAYEVQFSLDGGVSWSAPILENSANTTIPDLPRGAMVHVRYRTTVKGVTSDWSDPVAILVD